MQPFLMMAEKAPSGVLFTAKVTSDVDLSALYSHDVESESVLSFDGGFTTSYLTPKVVLTYNTELSSILMFTIVVLLRK